MAVDWSAELRHDQQRYEIARANRDRRIRDAHLKGGLSTRQIAALVGLSHQRVAQIIRGE